MLLRLIYKPKKLLNSLIFQFLRLRITADMLVAYRHMQCKKNCY